MSTVRHVLARTSGAPPYSPPFRVKEYTVCSVQRLESRRFAVTPVGHALTVNAGSEVPETVRPGLR